MHSLLTSVIGLGALIHTTSPDRCAEAIAARYTNVNWSVKTIRADVTFDGRMDELRWGTTDTSFVLALIDCAGGVPGRSSRQDFQRLCGSLAFTVTLESPKWYLDDVHDGCPAKSADSDCIGALRDSRQIQTQMRRFPRARAIRIGPLGCDGVHLVWNTAMDEFMWWTY